MCRYLVITNILCGHKNSRKLVSCEATQGLKACEIKETPTVHVRYCLDCIEEHKTTREMIVAARQERRKKRELEAANEGKESGDWP